MGIVISLLLAWYIGIRTASEPETVHSIGVVAQVARPAGNETYVPDRGRGYDRPAVAKCPACANGSDIMRYAPGGGVRIDMVVSVQPKLLPLPSCGNATVDLVISGTRRFWRQHPLMWQRVSGRGKPMFRDVLTRLALGWDTGTTITPPPGVALNKSDGGRSPVLLSFLEGDPQSPLHPGFYTNADLWLYGHANMVEPFPGRNPLGVRTQIYNWGGTTGKDLHEYPLHIHFVANWVKPRGYGSCYVVLPSLLANGTFAGTQDALEALIQRHGDVRQARTDMDRLLPEAQPPSYGRIALTSTGPFSLADTSPAPTDFEAVFLGSKGTQTQRAIQLAAQSKGTLGPVWTCAPSDNLAYLAGRRLQAIPAPGSYTGDACGAVAVVDAPGASDFRAIALIVLGVCVAIAFERLLSARRERPSSAPRQRGDHRP